MPPRELRWGLLSTARIHERLIPAIRATPRCRIVAVASRDPARGETFARDWNIPRSYGDYGSLLADPTVDVVYNPLPNALHAEWSVRAADAGKHVLCEKPLACSVEEVDRMCDAAARRGVMIQEATMMRFHPQTARLRELIADGAVGTVQAIRGLFTFVLARDGDIRFDPHLGGGSLWDLGCYCVSLMRTSLAQEPIAVHGWQRTGAAGADLCFGGQLLFPGDAVGQFFCSFAAFPHVEADVLGTAGRITLDYPWASRLGVTSRLRVCRSRPSLPGGTFSDAALNVDEEELAFEGINAYEEMIRQVTATLLDGSPTVVSLEESRANVAVLASLARSAAEGIAIRVG
ncbi:MAG: Gfo/Idh/MocA family protein [Planctomycetales bacterium]